MAKQKTEVAEKKQTGLADPVALFEQHAGEGLENVTSNDMLVPRITLLQALSPQLNKRKPEFIEGAEIGSIADVGTGEIFEAPLHFLPVHFSKVWIEWAPRESGNGLVEIHNSDAIMANVDEDYTLPSGNYVQETLQFFGLNLDAQARRSYISFASSQIKKARKWNTLVASEKVERPDGSMFTPPIFYRSYLLGSAEESNAQGDWAGWTIERGAKIEELPNFRFLYEEAIAFRESLIAGEAKADVSDLGSENAGESDNAF